jgi:diguanylate cyclase (GGDEF)-like protein
MPITKWMRIPYMSAQFSPGPGAGRIALVAPVLLLVAGLGLIAHILHAAVGLGGPGSDRLFEHWIYNGVILSGAFLCLLRAWTVRARRGAWLALGLGILSWALGEIYYSLVLAGDAQPPYPSPSDAFYLAFYPASYVALMLMVKEHIGEHRGSLWLDGLVAGLAAAAMSVAFLLEPVLRSTGGSTATVITDIAYPFGDVLLLATVIGAFSVTGWRPGRAWTCIGTALIMVAVADAVFLRQAASGAYVEGTVLDSLWPAATLLLGLSAHVRESRASTLGALTLLMPSLCGLGVLGLLVLDHYGSIGDTALWLSVLTLVAMLARLVLSFHENQRMLASTQRDALTDALTGLGNRRRLLADLDSELALATESEPRTLVLFDLDGFKGFNDTFGHPAGDGLLHRLGRAMADAVRSTGTAYRLGGDEFCVLLESNRPEAADVLAAASEALTEQGVGYSVAASRGQVLIPHEAADAEAAMRLADERLYRQKGSRTRGQGPVHTGDVLLRALQEREPARRRDAARVAGLTARVGARLGFADAELEELARAAELHDVGMIAVPADVLDKAGPLTQEEWELIRRHPDAGARMLEAVPGLGGIAQLIRSSHERWDGTGYPDQLAGEDIPLGARLIAACSSFGAMTRSRPHRDALSDRAALAEIQACSGTQFDPRVVDALAADLATPPFTLMLDDQDAGSDSTDAATPAARPSSRQASKWRVS